MRRFPHASRRSPFFSEDIPSGAFPKRLFLSLEGFERFFFSEAAFANQPRVTLPPAVISDRQCTPRVPVRTVVAVNGLREPPSPDPLWRCRPRLYLLPRRSRCRLLSRALSATQVIRSWLRTRTYASSQASGTVHPQRLTAPSLASFPRVESSPSITCGASIT